MKKKRAKRGVQKKEMMEIHDGRPIDKKAERWASFSGHPATYHTEGDGMQLHIILGVCLRKAPTMQHHHTSSPGKN